ncbi:MAG: hypothetical protein ABFD91_07035 [Anaerohalosphaeraceae bacterium]
MRLNPYLISIGVVIILSVNSFAARFYIPVIDGDWWQVASTPDLGQYNSDKQQPVDFSIWQAKDGIWQLWSCIRFTKLGGHTRLFYGWEGARLTDKDWTPKGIAMMGKPELGEPLGGLQAPHVIQHKGAYWMMYGDWDNMRMATSKDGKSFERLTWAGVLFSEGPRVNTRDPMLLFTRGKWNCYYTAFPAQHGYVYCRTSDDLLSWSDPVIVSYGGKAGNNPYSCECPHVVEISPGNYYLFRTQLYGPGAQTTIYQSVNPCYFGIDNDACYIRQMNLCAPEIVTLDGKYYIAALNPDLDGVRVARLKWKCYDKAVFAIDNQDHRAQWKLKEGDLKIVFTNSVRDRFCPRTEHFISTAETGPNAFDDALTGVIQSPVCKITAAECVLFISGGKDSQQVYICIEDAKTAQEYARFTGKDDNLFDPVFVDCRAFINKEVLIKIVDRSAQSWGHINFGGLYEASPVNDL